MYRWIAIALLAAGISLSCFWATSAQKDKKQVSLQAENHYQRAFHELTYNMDLLHEKVGTTLAMNSKERLSPQMLDIWRITSDAQGNLGQLPLALLPFNKTEAFLSRIGDFTYKTAARDLDKSPLTDKETKTLNGLYEQSKDLNVDLRKLQHKVLTENLSWLDAENSLASRNEKMDNTIMDGFQTVEKKVTGYDEANAGTSLVNNAAKEHSYIHIEGKKISEKEALNKAKRIVGDTDSKAYEIQKSGKGADVAAFNIVYQKGNRHANIDLTEKGGHPINILLDRPVPVKKISLHDGKIKAEKYLKDMDFRNMEAVTTAEYENTGVYTFLYKENDVRIYSDTVQVKIALDNGEVLGLSARNYFMNHHDRKIKKPDISLEDAKDKVNPNMEIHSDYLAIMDNEFGKEVLCYEFLGTHQGITYRIFINASDGREEKVERLEGTGNNI